MSSMFESASAFNQDISDWDVDNVTNMSFMFSGATEFNQDISLWEVGNVTNMSFMFEFASAFNWYIGGWNVSTVTDMSSMFSDASKFNQNIGGWEVGEVDDMSFMFFGASVFNQNIGGWDVSKVDNMEGMFEGATLSIANYDALLAGWSMLTLRSGIDFHAGNSQYCNQPARNILTETYDWFIDDEGDPATNCPLAFYEVIPDQFYTVGQNVSVPLPDATYGTGDLSYDLTPIPDGLTFTTATLTLAGTPTAAMAAVTLTYTVTDSAEPPTTAELTFMVTVNKGEQTGFAFANTEVIRSIGDPNFILAPMGGSGNGAVTYESSDTMVATVDSSGEVTIKTTGTTTITATKAADANYNEATATYTLTINPAALNFDEIITDQIYNVGRTVSVTLTEATGGTGDLSYDLTPIPDGLTFTTATLTLAGTPTAAMAAVTLTYTVTDSADSPTTAALTFIVTVNKGEQTGFGFANTEVIRSIGDDPNFRLAPTGGSGNGAVTYESDDTAVATVDNSGEVIIKTIGTTTITATKAGDANYNEATAFYILTVNPASLVFDTSIIPAPAPAYIYNVGSTVTLYLPPATGGTGDLSYDLKPIPVGLDFTTATLTLAGTPTAAMAAVTLTYTVTDSAEPPTTAELTFTVTVDKGEQTSFVFADTTVNKIIGEDSSTFTVTVTGGSGDGAVTYKSDDTTVATVDNSGEVIIKTIGTTTITATKAADANYNEATASYTLTVTTRPPVFDDVILNQTYNVGRTVSVTLTEAIGGTGDLSYDLTPIPDGLTFTTATLTLAGTPTTTADAVTLTYTVTDSAEPPTTAALTFTVTVDKGEQIGFVFTNARVNRTTRDASFTLTPTGGSGTGLVTYVSSDTTVATVDASSGTVTIVDVGTAIITATKAADANYNEATASYTLTVTTRPPVFDDVILNQTYNVGRTVSVTLTEATGGTGDLSYALTPIPDGLTFTTATLTLAGTPTAAMAAVTLTYTVTDSAEPPTTAELTFTVTVDKGEQTSFVFADTTVNKIIGEDSSTFTVTVTGGSGDGAVTYKSDDTTVATVDNSGEVIIKTIGTTTITATKAADANYNEATAFYILTVNPAPLVFNTSIISAPASAYTYMVGQTVSVTLPPATGGTGDLRYTLDGLIPLGLDFTTATLTLAGTPTATATAVTLTYTVTDSADSPTTAELTFMVTVNKGEQTGFGFANTEVIRNIGDDPNFRLAPTGGSGNGAVTYESDDTAVATVDSSGEVTIKTTGTTTITATKAADANYNEATASYTLTVTTRPPVFDDVILNQTYNVGRTVSVTLTEATGGTGDLSYALTPIPDGLTFTTATLTLAGTPTAAMAAVTLTYTVTDSAEPPTTAELTFMVTVNKGEQTGFGFANTEVIRSIGDDPNFRLATTGGSGNGAVTYESDDTAVATVDSSGEVTIKTTGTTTITATKAADANYNEATATYTLTINPAALNFDEIITDQIYNVGRTVSVTLTEATGGTGDLSYDLTPIPDGLTFTTATLTLAGTPTAAMAAVTLTYTVTDSAEPSATATLSFMVTVNKGDQTSFVFPDATVNKIIEEDSSTFTVTVTGGSGNGAVTYESDDTAVATVVADSGEVSIEGIGTTTITATKAADANYNEATASYTLTVTTRPPVFDDVILNQTYNVGRTVSVTLTEATGGTGDLSYALTPIPDGLTFTTATLTLAGTPTAAMAAVTLTYTVTDSAEPPTTAELTFMVTVNKGEQTGFGFANTEVIRSIGDDPNFRLATTGGSGDGAVTYKSDDTTVATVDNSGEVIIKTIGTTTITATKATDANYNEATAFYILTVNPAPLVFDTSIIPAPAPAYTYNVGSTVTLYLPPATGGLAPLKYTLTGTIPDGLRFTTATLTLAGTPTAAMTTVTLTYKVTDSNTPTATATLTFTVTVLSDAFITTWQISPGSENDRRITIPIHADSSYRYTVNWGEGPEDTTIYTSTILATHIYPNVATTTYKVTITGKFPHIYFNNGEDSNKIISIDQWGNNRWDSMESAFFGCSNLGYTAKDTPDLSQVTDMSHMFQEATLFNGDIGDWDVNNVTDMSNMFDSATVFNDDIGGWDVDKVTNMRFMFSGAREFNQNIGGWKVGEVTDMSFMFESALAFNQNIGSWDDVSNVTDMRSMFSGASAFNQNIGGWDDDVSNVTDMSSMFESALAFNQNIGGWDVGEVTDMNSMFSGASTFNQNIGGWDVGEVTDMNSMFSGASEFDQNISTWEVGEVIDMTEMFFDASQFDQNIGAWDVSKVEDMFDMFFGATLSIANYDALLAGWSMLTLRSGIDFHAGNSQYCNQPARDILTETYDWFIDDEGDPATNCPLGFYVDIPDQNYKVGETVSVILPEALYGIGDLSYTLDGPIPVGLRFTTATATPMLTGIPSTTATAVTLTYRVIDNGAVLPMPTTAELSFMVTVDKGDQTRFVFADTTVRRTIEDTDPFILTPNDDPGIGLGTGLVTYVSSDTMVATVDINTGAVTIQGIIGETTITATKAADANYNEATATYTLTVINRPPTIGTGLEDREAFIGVLFSYNISGAFIDLDDPDGGTLSYSTDESLSWLSFDTPTLTFSGTPTQTTDLGDNTITVTVTDSGNLSVSDSFILSVINDLILKIKVFLEGAQ